MAPELIEVMDKIMVATHNVSNDYTEEIAKLIHFFANHQQVSYIFFFQSFLFIFFILYL